MGRTVHWCVFDGGTQLGGALWFVQALFQISIVYAVVEVALRKLLAGRDTLLPQGFVAGVLLILGWQCSRTGWNVWGLGIAGQRLQPVLPGRAGPPRRTACPHSRCTGGAGRGRRAGAGAAAALRFGGAGRQPVPQLAVPAGSQRRRLDSRL